MDKVTKGFLAGILASIVINILNLFAYVLHLTTMLFLNWAGIFLFGRLTNNWGEMILGQFGQIIFSGFVGIGFAYFVSYRSRANYLFKGWLFSIAIWGFVYATSVAFRIPYLSHLPSKTVLSNLILTSVFGLLLAEALRWLNVREDAKQKT